MSRFHGDKYGGLKDAIQDYYLYRTVGADILCHPHSVLNIQPRL